MKTHERFILSWYIHVQKHTEKIENIGDNYIYEGSLFCSDLEYFIWEFLAFQSKLLSQNINFWLWTNQTATQNFLLSYPVKGEPVPYGTDYTCGFLYIVDVFKFDGSDFHCVRKITFWWEWFTVILVSVRMGLIVLITIFSRRA